MRCCRSTLPKQQVRASACPCAGKSWKRMAVASAWPTARMALPAQSLRCGSLAPRRRLDVARCRFCHLAPVRAPPVGASPVRTAPVLSSTRSAAIGGSLAAVDRRVVIALGGNQIDGFATEAQQVLAKVLSQLRVAQGELDGGLQVSELAAAVVALAREAVSVHGFFLHQRRDAVGELNLAARASPDLLQVLENRRRQYIT